MAVITDLSVIVDKEEYSRFEEENAIITAIIFPKPTQSLGETLTVELIKARRTRDKAVYTASVPVSGNLNSIEHKIDLRDLVDSENVSLLRRGMYFIKVSNADGMVTAESGDFHIVVISTARVKADYAFGLDLLANDVRGVLFQPKLIDGVRVTSVSKNHPEDFFNLNLEVGSTYKALSWRSGPLVGIKQGGTYLLKSKDNKDYIVVNVAHPDFLNEENTVEELRITKDAMPDETIRRYIRQAMDWTEFTALQTFIEPTQIVTEVGSAPFNFGGTNPQGIIDNSDYDYVRNPVTWYPTTEGHWIYVKLPVLWLIRVNNLFGKIADTRIIDVRSEWLEISYAQGYIELVPFNRQLGFTYEGLTWATALIGQGSLPNFWRYNVTSGLRDCPTEVQELAAKKAAIDVLTIAGQAFRGGFSAQSLSRDGVSESVTYTSSAVYGVYSSTIEELKRFIRDELPRLKGRYTGPRLTVV
jgi:hypothetical protein